MILSTIQSIYNIKDLRKKIIVLLLLILVYRFLATVPIPGVNTQWLSAIIDQQQWLAFFSALMWWGLENFSVILMWLSPYINAVIILQLLWVIVPKIGQLQKEWEQGQRIITRYTRWLTLPLAFAQSYGMIVLLNTLAGWTIIDTNNLPVVLTAMTIATAGTIFLMWLWEIMTEYGISNGISLIIMAWVLSMAPAAIMEYVASSNYALFASIIILTLAIIYIIVKFTEWHRRIPIIYAKTWGEEKSFFPIKVNQAGMIPIIFAVSLVTFPAIIWQILANSNSLRASQIGTFMLENFSMQNPSWIFIAIYFLMVVWFSFFYVSITFNTEQVAENIQKRGGYIPGIRPGEETANYLQGVSNRLNVFGGSFLALIAVLPFVMWKFLWQTVTFIIDGAGLIIIVAVLLDLIRRVDGEMKMFDYSKYK